MSDFTEDDVPSLFDEAPSETPFDPKEGINFKYGRLFKDRELELRSFEAHCEFSLPEDFLSLIGDYAEGGFDGWYQVKKGESGSIVWNHLLLMRLPVAVDYEVEQGYASSPQLQDRTSMTVKILERDRSLFYTYSGVLAYFPFGTACVFKPDRTEATGFLVFDVERNNRVKYISKEIPKKEYVAETFSKMMDSAKFQFYG